MVINSTQSLGSLYFNVKEQGVDFAATNGHKWILSSFGIGAIYINKKYLDEYQLKPSFFSHFGQKQIIIMKITNKLKCLIMQQDLKLEHLIFRI